MEDNSILFDDIGSYLKLDEFDYTTFLSAPRLNDLLDNVEDCAKDAIWHRGRSSFKFLDFSFEFERTEVVSLVSDTFYSELLFARVSRNNDRAVFGWMPFKSSWKSILFGVMTDDEARPFFHASSEAFAATVIMVASSPMEIAK